MTIISLIIIIDDVTAEILIGKTRALSRPRSIATSLNTKLQAAVRDVHGRLTGQFDELQEKSSANSIRSKVVSYLIENINEYKDLEPEFFNGDQPQWIRFKTIEVDV